MQFAAVLSIFICCSLASSTITLPSSSGIQETDSNETSQAYKGVIEYAFINKLFPFLMHDEKMNKQNSNERAVNATTSETTTTTDPANSTTEIRQAIVTEITTRTESEPSSTMNSEASSNANDQSRTAQVTVSEILEDSSSPTGGSTTVGTSQIILEQTTDLSSESASKEVEKNHSSDGLNRVTGLESTTNFDDLISSGTNQESTAVDEISFNSEQTSKSFSKRTSQTEFSVRTSFDYITLSDRPATPIPTNEHFGTTEGLSNFQSTEPATHNHPETDVFTDNGRRIDTTEIDYQKNLQQEQITPEFVSEVVTSSDQVQTSFNEKSIRVTSQRIESSTDGEASSPLTTENGHIFTNELELLYPIHKPTSQQTTPLGSTARFHLAEYSTPPSSNQITDRTQASIVSNIDESRAITEVTTTENVESLQEQIIQTTVVQLPDGTNSDNSTTAITDKTMLPNVEKTDRPNTDKNQEFSTRSSTSEIISSAITEQLQEETSRSDYSPKTLTPQISTTTFKEFPDPSTTLRTLESNIVTMELLDEVSTESVPKLSTAVPKLPNTSIHSSRPSTTSKIPALPTIRNSETTTSDTHQRHLPKSLTTESISITSKPIGTSTRAHRLHIDPSEENSPLSSTSVHHTSMDLPSTILADNPPTSTWCPCLGSILSGCLQYDSRLQAMTLEEAMIAFPDLTRSQNVVQPTTIEDEITCTTKECIDCQKDMRKKLAEVGLLPNAIDIAMHAQGNYTNCKKYGFSSGDKKKKDKKKKDSHESSESREEKEDHKRKNKDEDKKKKQKQKQKDKSSEKKDKSEERDRKKKKHKRQTLADGVTDPNIIGTRYTMSCTQKGVATDSFGLVPLCSSCWVWRKLPDNYSPQYINELVCDNSDGSCLSGYATCNAGQRIVDAIRNDNGVETRVALTAGTYCECKITSGSAIASLIEGTGLQGPISPLASPIP